jgi:transposase InsO family protein
MDDSHPSSPLGKMFDAILGMDLWTTTKAVIDFADKKLVVGSAEIPLRYNHPSPATSLPPCLPIFFTEATTQANEIAEIQLINAMSEENETKSPQIRQTRKPLTVTIRPTESITIPSGRVRIIECAAKRLKPERSDWVFCYRILHQQVEAAPLYILPTRWDRVNHDTVHLAFQNTGTRPITLSADDSITMLADVSATDDPEVCNVILEEGTEEYKKEWDRLAAAAVDAAKTTPASKVALKKLIEEFRSTFKLKSDPPGCVTHNTVTIELHDESPCQVKQYNLSPTDRKIIETHIEDMLRTGVIRKSHSPHQAPVLLANKKVNTREGPKQDKRFCIDFRELNRRTKKRGFPIPLIDETLRSFAGCKYFTTFDILKGFWHLPLDEKSKPYTAFCAVDAKFEFNVLPFGWVNSPYIFQEFVRTRIVGEMGAFCSIYIDDIMVFSKTEQEHLKHIEMVLQACAREKVSLKLSKCTFFADEVEYLGHIVGATGVRKDPAKTAAIDLVPAPRTRRQVRSFLGKVQYYAKFVPHLSHLAKPMHHLTKDSTVFTWTDQCQRNFEEIKRILSHDVTLAYPDMAKPFTLTTDASDYAIGAVLSQTDDVTGRERPISFLSKSLSGPQLHWSTTEKELYAIIYALEKYQGYLYGHPFTVHTDHRALLWLCGRKRPMGRLARWCMTLNQYAPSITYIRGKDNYVADALSRAPFAPEKTADDVARDPTADVRLVRDMREKILKAAGISEEDLAGLDGEVDDTTPVNMTTNNGDEEPVSYHPLLLPQLWAEALNDDQLPKEVFRAADGLLYTERRAGTPPLLWVPPIHRQDVLRMFHQGPLRAHQAADSMLEAIKKECWWAGCERAIRKHCKRCGQCQLFRADRPDKPHLQSRGDLFRPFQRISMDILIIRSVPGATSHPNVLIIMDELTRYTEAYPLKNHDADSVARVLLDSFITRYGVPREILTDRGAEFIGEIFTTMCRILKIKKLNTCSYRPQGNGANERVHQTLYTFLRNLCRDHPGQWRQFLPYAMYAYHTQHHRSIGMTPQEALYGYTARVIPFDDATLPPSTSLQERLEMLRAIHENAATTSKTESAAQRKLAKTRPSPAYDVGDLVKVTNRMQHKLDAKWRGPYAVVRRVSTTAYEVKLNQGERTHHIVHHAHLRPWYAPDEDAPIPPDESDVDDDADNGSGIDERDEPAIEDRGHGDPRQTTDTELTPAEDPRPMADAEISPAEDPTPIAGQETALPEDPSPEDPLSARREDPRPTTTMPQRRMADDATGVLQRRRGARRAPTLAPIEEEGPSSNTGDEAHQPPHLQPHGTTRRGRRLFLPAKYRD